MRISTFALSALFLAEASGLTLKPTMIAPLVSASMTSDSEIAPTARSPAQRKTGVLSLRRIRRRSGSRSSPILSAPLPLHLEEPRTRRSSPASSSICGSTAILISGSSKAPGSATKHRTLSNTAATASLPNITMSLSLTGRKRNLTRSMRPVWNCMS